MYIRKRKEFLILENLKQAREYLTDNNIDINLPEFQHITKTLNRQPNLIDTFTRMVFKDGLDNLDANIVEFDRIYNWITNNRNIVNQLPKNLMQYKNLEDIADDITQLELDRKFDGFVNELHRTTRSDIKRLSKEKLGELRDLVMSYMELSEDQKNMMPPPISYQKRYGSTIDDLMKDLDTLINSPEDIDQEKKRVWGVINKHLDALNIVYNKDGVLVIESNDKETVCNLGSGSWCFVYAPDTYYRQYIDPNTLNTQYIIFDFNLPPSNRYSMFGVTLNQYNNPIYGGSQDRINNHVPLETIYKLTKLPKGILINKYKELHDRKLSELEEVIKGSKDVFPHDEVEKIISSLYSNIGVNSKSSVRYSELYYTALISHYIQDISDIDELNDRISVLTKQVVAENTDNSVLNLAFYYKELPIKVLEWIVHNNKDKESLAQMLDKSLDNPNNPMMDSSVTSTAIKKNSDRYNLLLDKITKNKETLLKYFLGGPDVIRLLDISLIEIIKHRNVTSWTTFNDTIFLTYLYTYRVCADDDIAHYQKILSFDDEFVDIFIDIKDTSAIDVVYNHIDTYKDLAKELHKIPLSYRGGKTLTLSDIIFYMERGIENLTHIFLEIENIPSFEEFKERYDKLGETQSDTFIAESIVHLYDKFSETDYDDLVSYFVSILENDPGDILTEITESINPDYSDILSSMGTDQLSYELFTFIGEILIGIDVDISGEESNILIYVMGMQDSKYLDAFYKGIGLEYHKEYNQWYTETNLSDLGEYFDPAYEFEDYDTHRFHTFLDHDHDILDNLDINNLSILSKHFKENGFDIDISPLDKYPTNTNYIESSKLYNEDKELKSLLKQVKHIITQTPKSDDIYSSTDISTIRSHINSAYSNVYYDTERNLIDELYLTEIGDKLLEPWRVEEGTFAHSYFRYDSNNNLLMIPDLDKIIDNIDINVLSGECSLDSVDIDSLIYSYFESDISHLETPSYDYLYVDMGTDELEYFNEDLRQNLSFIVKENTRNIMNISEFLSSKYRRY